MLCERLRHIDTTETDGHPKVLNLNVLISVLVYSHDQEDPPGRPGSEKNKKRISLKFTRKCSGHRFSCFWDPEVYVLFPLRIFVGHLEALDPCSSELQ